MANISKAEQLRERTKRFAIRIVPLVPSLPRTLAADVIGRQILKSGTSVAAKEAEELTRIFSAFVRTARESSRWTFE